MIDSILNQRYRRDADLGRGGMSSDSVRKLVKQLGPQEIHPNVAPILALHDRLTGVEDQRPLA